MDDEVVIELGSSDEEAEPPPKKRKPVPNAMVHIPTMLPGITIKPAKINKSIPTTIQGIPIKQSAKPVNNKVNTAQKSNMIFNPFVNKLNNNSVTVNRGNTVIFKKEAGKPPHNRPQTGINPISLNKGVLLNQIKKGPKQIVLKKSLPIKGPQVLNFLPSSITVTKAPISKPKIVPSVSGLPNKKIATIKKPILRQKEVLTVNLDDDESIESTPSAQWYMKPEEEGKNLNELVDGSNEETENLEEQNNKEPEVKKYVEITIEDSPMKPVECNQASDIGKELPIIIEDSPCKVKPDLKKTSEGSEKPTPQSKKKLDYPKSDEGTKQIVEIEIDPIATMSSSKDSEKKEDCKNSYSENVTKNNSEEPKATNECDTKPEYKMEEEFHSVYQEFIDTCFKLENSDDMKKIVEKKIKTYYKQCPKEYVESEEFIDIVSSKIMAMNEGPDKLYLYIKDVVDELNLQRKMAKAQEAKKEIAPKEKMSDVPSEEESGLNTKRSRQIRKLDKTIKKLHRAIQKLEEQEVDFDDEDDSVFLLTERYKERLVRVHAKYCQMTNTKMPSEPRIVLEARPGRPLGPTKKLEKFINKKVPIGTPLPFPDFHDVVRCVQEANKEDNLGWNDMDIKEEARDLFVRCGKKLQRRRQENEWRIAISRVQTEVDPAERNENLKQKLKENKAVAAKRENEIFNKFVERQNQLKLEAEEIGDKEAEESPVESDEEDMVEISSSLEDKQKRKERLKRLIQEKSKKVSNEKDAFVEEKEEKNDIVPENNDKVPENNDDNIKIMEEHKKDCEEAESKSSNSGINIPNEDMEEKTKDSEEPESKSDNPVNIDADDLNNNDDKDIESNVIDIDSDIDELHLLQKLRFEDEITSSSSYSSDSDSPIAISDSLDSDSDNANKRRSSIECDVISIENSSYSESEAIVETDIEMLPIIDETDTYDIEVIVSKNREVEFSTEASKNPSKANHKDLMENILLAPSEDDRTSEKNTVLAHSEKSIELKGNTLSEDDETLQKDNPLKEGDICINLNDNASSEDDGSLEKDNALKGDATCVNVNDNVWSEDDGCSEKDVLKDNETCINLNDNASSEDDGSSEKDNALKDGELCISLNDNASSEDDGFLEKENALKSVETCITLNDNASSEEDGTSQKDTTMEDDDTCINLRDDSISITEMLIEDEDMEKESETNKIGKVDLETLNTDDGSPSVVLVESKDNMNEPEICLSDINHKSEHIHVKDNDNDLEIIEKEASVDCNKEAHKT